MNDTNPNIDLLLKGGRVLDPANHQDGIADVDSLETGRVLYSRNKTLSARALHRDRLSGPIHRVDRNHRANLPSTAGRRVCIWP